MAIIINSYTNVVSSFFSAKFQKNIEELLVSPTPNYIIIWGYVVGGVMRALMIGTILIGVSLFFTRLHLHNIPIILLFSILTSIVCALGGFLNSIFAKKFDDLFIVPTFILTPLTYLGGVFYSISLLPSFWQKISLFNPILYIIDGFRYGFLGIADSNILIGIVMLIVLAIVLFAVNLHLLKKGIGMRN